MGKTGKCLTLKIHGPFSRGTDIFPCQMQCKMGAWWTLKLGSTVDDVIFAHFGVL